jgi:hypothetical protein
MRPLAAVDEYPHEPEGASSAPWVDTWWFVCRDLGQDVVIETHVTLIATAGVARSATMVQRGSRATSSVAQGPPTVTPASHGTDEVTVHVVEPEWDGRKRLRVQGRLPGARFEVSLAGRFQAADATVLAPGFMPVDAGSGAAMRNAQHGMTFEGWVELDGEITEVRGMAMRDRSWGWREHSDLLRHGWLALLGHTGDAVFSGVGFYAGEERSGDGGRLSAWVSDRDGIRMAHDASIELDGSGVPSAISLTTATGTLRATRSEHLGATFLPMHEAHGSDNQRLIAMMNHHLRLEDAHGHQGWAYANIGWPILTKPWEGMEVFPRAEVVTR